jgi:uncharacterized cupin superfamily protein
MTMEKVTIENVEPDAPPDENVPDGAAANSVGDARQLTGPLGTTGLAINYYELAPGESFTLSAHRHSDQEELFYVRSGTATFETEAGDLTVEAGEVLRVPPSTFQLGTNRGDERVTALTLGAPREYRGQTQWLVDCDDCGERTVHVFEKAEARNDLVCRCTDCDTEAHRISL